MHLVSANRKLEIAHFLIPCAVTVDIHNCGQEVTWRTAGSRDYKILRPLISGANVDPTHNFR